MRFMQIDNANAAHDGPVLQQLRKNSEQKHIKVIISTLR